MMDGKERTDHLLEPCYIWHQIFLHICLLLSFTMPLILYILFWSTLSHTRCAFPSTARGGGGGCKLTRTCLIASEGPIRHIFAILIKRDHQWPKDFFWHNLKKISLEIFARLFNNNSLKVIQDYLKSSLSLL